MITGDSSLGIGFVGTGLREDLPDTSASIHLLARHPPWTAGPIESPIKSQPWSASVTPHVTPHVGDSVVGQFEKLLPLTRGE